MKNKPLLEALVSEKFSEVETALDGVLQKDFTLNQQIQEKLRKLASLKGAEKDAFLLGVAQEHPKRFAKMVEYLSVRGELLHLAADAAHWQANDPSQSWREAIALAKEKTDGSAKEVMSLLSQPGIRHERIGTEHPTEPLSPMRLIAQEMFQAITGAYIRFKRDEHYGSERFRCDLLKLLQEYQQARKEIDVSFEREVKGQEHQFTRAKNTLKERISNWEENISDISATNGELAEQLEGYLEQVVAESLKLIKDMPITAPQKRTADEENRRHQKYHRQAGRNQRAVWELLHEAFSEDSEAVDNAQIFFNGSWEGDADGKPAVTPQVTRHAVVQQMVGKIEEGQRMLTENILPLAQGEGAEAFKRDIQEKLLDRLDFYRDKLQAEDAYSRNLTKEEIALTVEEIAKKHASLLGVSPELRRELSYFTFWNTNNFQARIFVRQNASVDEFITTMMLEDAKTHPELKNNGLLTEYLRGRTFADLSEEEKQKFHQKLQEDSSEANTVRTQLRNWKKRGHYAAEDNLQRFAERLIRQNSQSKYLAEKKADYNKRRQANNKPLIQNDADFVEDLVIDLKAIQVELDRNNEVGMAAYIKADGSMGNPFETIIADTEEYSDIQNRLFIMKIAGAFGKASVLGLHESKESHQLAAKNKAEGIYHAAMKCPVYQKHLETLYGPELAKNVVKFNARSDSSKRGGLFANLFIEYYTDKARVVTATASDGKVSLGLKEGGGHNLYRGAGDVTPSPFKTEQAKHKAMLASQENFLETTGNVTLHAVEQHDAKVLQQRFKEAKAAVRTFSAVEEGTLHDEDRLNNELRKSYKALMNEGAENYKAFREDLTFYNYLMANAGPRKTVEEKINKSARGERTDLTGAGSSEYTHPYAHLMGDPKQNLPVVGEQRAIGDDAGSSTYTRTETNKLHTYIDTLKNFRPELSEAERFQHVQGLYRMSYGFRNNVIMPMLMGCFRSDHERAFDFLPEDQRPQRQAGEEIIEFAECKQVKAWAKEWKEYHAEHGYPTSEKDCKAMAPKFRAYEAVKELETRRYLFDVLKAVYPQEAKERLREATTTPSKEDLLFIFPEAIREQRIAQKAQLDQATDIVSFIHQCRIQGKGLDTIFPKDWKDMDAIKSGGHDKLSEMLEQAVAAMEEDLRPPVRELQPNCSIQAAKGFSTQFAQGKSAGSFVQMVS